MTTALKKHAQLGIYCKVVSHIFAVIQGHHFTVVVQELLCCLSHLALLSMHGCYIIASTADGNEMIVWPTEGNELLKPNWNRRLQLDTDK